MVGLYRYVKGYVSVIARGSAITEKPCISCTLHC